LEQHGGRQGEINHLASNSPREPSSSYGDGDAVAELLWAAYHGDLAGLRRLVAQGVPVDAADYDGRTALHLAAAENNVAAARYLLFHGHPLNVQDRWNATPLDEARRESAEEVAILLDRRAFKWNREGFPNRGKS
jgi:ankyrin repeat protein